MAVAFENNCFRFIQEREKIRIRLGVRRIGQRESVKEGEGGVVCSYLVAVQYI